MSLAGLPLVEKPLLPVRVFHPSVSRSCNEPVTRQTACLHHIIHTFFFYQLETQVMFLLFLVWVQHKDIYFLFSDKNRINKIHPTTFMTKICTISSLQMTKWSHPCLSFFINSLLSNALFRNPAHPVCSKWETLNAQLRKFLSFSPLLLWCTISIAF